MRWFLVIAAVLSLASTAQHAWAQEKPVLQAGSETRTAGEVRPSPRLVRAFLGILPRDNMKELDGCLADQGLKRGDYAALLSAVGIPAGQGRNLWFVRSSDERYCQALQGAHLFRYFLFEERPAGQGPSYRVVFQNSGDEFAIYAKQSHGLNDIEATGCIAAGCRSARLSYDGQKYRPVRCFYRTFDDRRTIVRLRRCGSDAGRDDQASGLDPEQ